MPMMVSCAFASYDRFATDNREKLAFLEPGMTKAEVIKIMGSERLGGGLGAEIRNPFKTETISLAGQAPVLVFWYYSEVWSQNGRVDPDELTPVVFKDGKLEGYGWSFYEDRYKHVDVRIRGN